MPDWSRRAPTVEMRVISGDRKAHLEDALLYLDFVRRKKFANVIFSSFLWP